jgi:type VI secretion system protein ImpH
VDAASGQSSTAVERGKYHVALLRLLREGPFSLNFFQAVRLIERLFPERMPVGHFGLPQSEVIRFSARTSLAFPASDVHGFHETESRPNEMEVNFMGLTAMNGPLPFPYVEHLLARTWAKDFASGEFLDLFNHRFVALFYRSWKKYRFFVGYELDNVRGQMNEDPVTMNLYSLLGFGTKGLLHRTAIPDEAMLYYAGLLGRNVPTAQALKQLLSDFLDIPVEIVEFIGTWNPLREEYRTYLWDTSTQSECLGFGAIVGDAVWDPHGTVEVRLGPMSLEQYQDFLPGGDGARKLEGWLRLFGKNEIDFVVHLVLAQEEVPGVLLTSDKGEMRRLGFESWLKNRPFTHDADDVSYRLY